MKYKLASIIHRGVFEGVVPRKLKVCAPVNTPSTVEDETLPFGDRRGSSEGKAKVYASRESMRIRCDWYSVAK